MRVEWLPEALRSLNAQLDWIAEQDPWAAIDAGDAVQAAVARLADDPAMARRSRVTGTRELIVVGTPYVIAYRIEAAAVVVLRVLHGATLAPRLTRERITPPL